MNRRQLLKLVAMGVSIPSCLWKRTPKLEPKFIESENLLNPPLHKYRLEVVTPNFGGLWDLRNIPSVNSDWFFGCAPGTLLCRQFSFGRRYPSNPNRLVWNLRWDFDERVGHGIATYDVDGELKIHRVYASLPMRSAFDQLIEKSHNWSWSSDGKVVCSNAFSQTKLEL